METADFEEALAAHPEGYSEGLYEGRRYGVSFANPTMNDATACLRENWQVQTLPVSIVPWRRFQQACRLNYRPMSKVHDKWLSDR
jgi:hypothetical protein